MANTCSSSSIGRRIPLTANVWTPPRIGYREISNTVLEHIQNGRWAAGHRVPSETELMSLYGVSKMTASRAMQEVRSRGAIVSVHGVGCFVKGTDPVPDTIFRSASGRNCDIADEGQVRILRLDVDGASPEVADRLGVRLGDPILYLLAVRPGESSWSQIEETSVRCDCAPDFLKQDFCHGTALQYLQGILPQGEVRAEISAIMPSSRHRRIGGFLSDQPCIQLQQELRMRGQAVLLGRLIGRSYRFANI